MAKAAANDQLREAFQNTCARTSEQVSRLEQIFDQLEENRPARVAGMEGLVKEGAES